MAETHEIVLLDRKLSDLEIQSAVGKHFEAEALRYDALTDGSEKRRNYLAAIDSLVAQDLGKSGSVSSVLSIACGTGRREIGIRSSSGLSFAITGVDISKTMCVLAEQHGIQAIHSPWLDADLADHAYDAVLYLHSFGLAPSREMRLKELEDKNEWGPKILELYRQQGLERRGYEMGDVFYRRIGGSTVSYFHYFSQQELEDLFVEAGFSSPRFWYVGYGARFGEQVAKNEGAILAAAEVR